MTRSTPEADRQSRSVLQRIILWATLGSLAANLIKYYFFKTYPIYADEIGYRIMTARYLLDDHQRISTWPVCVANYAIKLPFFMRMAAYALSPLAVITDFAIFRIVAIAILALGVVSLMLAGRRLKLPLQTPEVLATFLLLATFVMSIQTFSLASIALYMVRGEYLVLIAIPLLLFAISKENMSATTRWGWYAASVALFTLSAYVHPKTLFYIPFFAGFVWFLFRQSHVALRGLLIVPFVAITIQCVDIINAQWLKCDEYPGMAVLNASFNINIVDLLKGKNGVIADILTANNGFNTNRIFRAGLFSVKYLLHEPDIVPYLNRDSIWALIGYPAANIFIVLCTALSLTGTVAVVIAMTRRLVNAYKSIANVQVEYAVILLAGIGILCTIVNLVLNRSRNFYDFAAWSYLFTLFAAFGLLAICSLGFKSGVGLGRIQPYQHRIYAGLALFLLLGNLTNTLVLREVLYLPVIHGWIGDDEMPILSAKDKEGEAKRVAEFLPRCGPITPSSRFVLDYRVYPYLEQYPKPAPLKWLWTAFDTAMKTKPWEEKAYLPRCNRDDKNFAFDVGRTTPLSIKEYPPQTPPTILWTPFEIDKNRKLWLDHWNAEHWEDLFSYMRQQNITAVVGICPSFSSLPSTIHPIQEEGDHGWEQSFCCLRAPP